MTVYLTVVEVIAIHDDQIGRYGGAPGIRDPGLLEAVLFRPQTGYYADLIEEAAVLWESLAQNHPFIERLWRSLKYECVYINAFETGSELRAGLARWITYYNGHRPHSALAGATPDEVYEVQAGAPPYPGLAPDRAKPEDQLAA